LGINYFNFQNRIDRNGDNFTDMTLQNRISAFNKWSFTRKNNRIATIAGRYIYEDRFGGEMQWTKADRGTDNRYGESIYTARYELLGAYQLPLSKEKLTIQYSFNHHHQNSYYGTVSYIGTQRIGFMQLLWDKKIGKNDVLVGIPVRSTYYSDNSAVNFSGDSNKIGTTTNLVGAFVQDDIKINSKLSLLLSTRYDHSNTHGNIYSPRVAVKYAPRPYDIFRISAGNGFRVVNLATEDHAALSGARKVIVAEKLKPETSYSLTGNYQRLINHRYGFVTLDFGAFYTYFENKIVADYFVSPTQIVYDNLSGYGISQGFNFNLDFSFENSLKIIAGITYLDVYQVEKGEQQRTVHTPPLSGTYTVSYTLPKHNITFDLTGRVTSPMLLPVLPNDFRPDHSPYFNLANLQITKPFKNGIEIYGGIKNIFNFLPQNPIMRPFDPFDKNVAFDTAGNPLPTPDNPQAYTFDPTYNYAPMQGIRGFAGIRWRVDKQ
jgi:outer membrane receptor for ferrienterochelin and colicins